MANVRKCTKEKIMIKLPEVKERFKEVYSAEPNTVAGLSRMRTKPGD